MRRHSRIKFVTPAQRIHGEDKKTLEPHGQVYGLTKANVPDHWSGEPRSWKSIGALKLNPERPIIEKVKKAS